MCSAGWLDQLRVAYPTTYANSLCGFGHVGIVDYGTRKNLSETWDTFCYRMKGERGRGGLRVWRKGLNLIFQHLGFLSMQRDKLSCLKSQMALCSDQWIMSDSAVLVINNWRPVGFRGEV